MSRRQLVLRAMVVAAAVAAGCSGAPKPVVAVLGVLSLLNTAELLGRLGPGQDVTERVLFAVMGATVSLVILGLILNELPGRLSTTNWTIGWAAFSALVLGTVALPRGEHQREPALRLAPRIGWLAPVVLVVAAAVAGTVIADAGTRTASNRPVLALSAVRWTRTSADLQINADHIGGAFRLSVRADSRQPTRAGAMRVSFSAGQATTRQVSVNLPPARAFWKVTLTPVRGGAGTTRSLILTPGGSARASS